MTDRPPTDRPCVFCLKDTDGCLRYQQRVVGCPEGNGVVASFLIRCCQDCLDRSMGVIHFGEVCERLNELSDVGVIG